MKPLCIYFFAHKWEMGLSALAHYRVGNGQQEGLTIPSDQPLDMLTSNTMRTRKNSPRSIKKQQCFPHFTEDPRHKINTVPPTHLLPSAFLRQLGNGWSGESQSLDQISSPPSHSSSLIKASNMGPLESSPPLSASVSP